MLVSYGILELMSQDVMMQRYCALLPGKQGADLDMLTAGLDVLAEKRLPDDITFLVVSRSPANG